jgi:hypothetical protein
LVFQLPDDILVHLLALERDIPFWVKIDREVDLDGGLGDQEPLVFGGCVPVCAGDCDVREQVWCELDLTLGDPVLCSNLVEFVHDDVLSDVRAEESADLNGLVG